MLWDSRVQSLETQALEPLEAREEMRGDAFTEDTAVDGIVARLRENAEAAAGAATTTAWPGSTAASDAWPT